MKKRLIAALIIAVMIASVFAGCGAKNTGDGGSKNDGENKGGNVRDTITAIFGSEPGTIDPAINQTLDAGTYISHLFEGLTDLSQGGIKPGVAESWDISDDGTKYTFHLREDAKWSDGKPVTAYDFEYAWKRVLNPETASPYSYILYLIKGAQEYNEGNGKVEDVAIKAVDEKTFEVELIAKAPYFLELAGFMVTVPVRQDIIEKHGDAWTQSPETYISNGAFKLKEWKHQDELVVVKNENYWNKDEIKLNEIRFKLMDDDDAALSATEAGEIDINYAHMPPNTIPGLVAEGKAEILPDFTTYFYDFNTQRAPFDDARVRKAFALAIDRQYIIDKVAMANQKPAIGWVPYGMPEPEGDKDFRAVAEEKYGSPYLPETANVEEAKKLLAEAGYPNGEGFPEVELIYNTSEGHKMIAEAIQNQLKENLGVNIKISNMEWNVFVEERNKHNFDIARDGWGADYADPMSFMDMWLSNSGNNTAAWKNAEYDELINKAINSDDANERFELMHKAEQILMDEMPILPVYYYTKTVMYPDNLEGWYFSPVGIFYLHRAEFK